MADALPIDLAGLRKLVRDRGDYQNKQKFPDDFINSELQIAFGAYYELVDDVNEGWWDTTTPESGVGTLITTASTAFVALPSDHWRERRLDQLDGSDWFPMQHIGLADITRFGGQPDQPVGWRLSARGIELYPTPDAAYTLRLTYAPRAPLLQEVQPREWYNGWQEYVVEAVLIVLDRQGGKPTMQRHQDAVDRATARVKAGATKRQSQEPEYIPMYDGSTLLPPRDRGIF